MTCIHYRSTYKLKKQNLIQFKSKASFVVMMRKLCLFQYFEPKDIYNVFLHDSITFSLEKKSFRKNELLIMCYFCL